MKPWGQFPRTSTTATGRATYCLPCHNARGKASREKVGGSRTYHLARRYGISSEEFDVMYAAQGGLCAICVSTPAQHVDHDHASGRVRQLLCFNCNGGLGQFKDDPAVLRAAAGYVERHRDRQVQGDGASASLRRASRRSRGQTSPDRLRTRGRASGCRRDTVVRARIAVLVASLDGPR